MSVTPSSKIFGTLLITHILKYYADKRISDEIMIRLSKKTWAMWDMYGWGLYRECTLLKFGYDSYLSLAKQTLVHLNKGVLDGLKKTHTHKKPVSVYLTMSKYIKSQYKRIDPIQINNVVLLYWDVPQMIYNIENDTHFAG